MTNEEKQALIQRCEQKIKELSKVQFGIMHKDKLDLLIYCHAIAALTTQPVNIKNSDFESALTLLNDVLDDCGDSERGLLLALSRMGIEVQE